MIKQNKQLILKIIIGIIILSFANTSYSRLAHNWSDCAYEGECDGGELTSLINTPMSISMHTYIVEGAGYFLDSHSSMQAFFNRVEMSDVNGVDYNELREILYKAIEDMEKAKEAYYNLKIKADNTPYKMSMIEILMQFDFEEFQLENGLLPSIFEKVEYYLSKGDVRGLYATILSSNEEILYKLYEIKEVVDADQFPEITKLWRINQKYAEFQLFGQYTSEVFKKALYK